MGIAVLFVYTLPQALNRILFLIFIYFFYKSDRDYLWLAFIFIIIERPGGLFAGGDLTEEVRMPIYKIAPKISITIQQLFVLTALLKAVKKKIQFNPLPFFKNNLNILLIYLIFLIIIGVLIGFTMDVGGYVYIMIINLSLFYSLYCLFTKETDYVNFFRMLIPFGFITFGLQLYHLSSGKSLIHFFQPAVKYTDIYSTAELIRPIEMATVLAVLFFFSLYFLIHKKKYFNNNLLISLNIISFFSIIITATRGWTVMFILFYVLCFIFISSKIGSVVAKYGLAVILTVIILFSADLFVNQISRALVRLSTIELIAGGDITGGGTLSRYDVRAPELMDKYLNETTIVFGAGFSKTYMEYSDAHVGFHNLLFNAGIVGVILFAGFYGSVILNTLRINRKLSFINPYKDIIKVFPIIIVSILFVNGGTQFYGFDIDFNRTFLIVFTLYFLNNQINCAAKWEEEN